MKKLLLFAEKCFAVLALFCLSGGVYIGSTEQVRGGLIPELGQSAILYAIWTMSVLLLILYAKRTLITMRRDWLFWVFALLVMFSFAWSEYPAWTLLNNREFARMVCFGLYFATRFDLKQQVRLVAITLTVSAVLSTLFAIGFPRVGIDEFHVPAWKGIYDSKNTFGSIMVVMSIAFFSLPVEQWYDRLIKWGGISFSTALILLSTSKTALVVSIVFMVLMNLYQKFQWQGKRSVVLINLGILAVSCVLVGAIANLPLLLEALGRDVTFTGRTYIWQVSLDHLADRPWLGFGRGAFWSPQSPFPKQISYFLSQGFSAPHAHSGYIETALDVGLIGLTLVVICFVTAYAAALKRAYGTKHSENLWPLGFLTFLALSNVTESYFLRLSNIYCILFIATVLTVKARSSMPDEEVESSSRYEPLPMREEHF